MGMFMSVIKFFDFSLQGSHKISGELRKERAVFKLATRLIQAAKNSRLDKDALQVYLGSLKKQYLKEIDTTEE